MVATRHKSPAEPLIPADNLPPRILGAGNVPDGGRRKLEALDGLRGIAVLAVMFSHFDRFLPAGPVLTPLKNLVAYGWIGVDLFFVLSGFLITGILLQTRTALNFFQSFYIRRVLRIFPIYYLTLIAVFIAAGLLPNVQRVPPSSQRWLYFTYFANWIPVWTKSWPPNVVGHFWSLAVEEQFYLVWPLCVFFLSRRRLFRTAIVLSVAALVLRCVWVDISGPNEAVMLGTFTRMDSLLAGAIGALLFTRWGHFAPPRYLLITAAVALSTVALGVVISTWEGPPEAGFPFLTTIGYTLLAVGFGALILYTALGDGRRDFLQIAFNNSILKRVGKYSYGMYVYHVPILGLMELFVYQRLPEQYKDNPAFGLLYAAVLTIVTFVIAMMSFELLERRILNLKRHAEPVFSPSDIEATSGAA